MDDRIKTFEGDFNARGLRFGIVASRFNDFIVDRLLDAAVATLLFAISFVMVLATGRLLRRKETDG